MKYTLYKDDKFIMQRKHFYPIKMYLIKSLGIKNIYIPHKDLMEMAKKNNYKMEVESEEKSPKSIHSLRSIFFDLIAFL